MVRVDLLGTSFAVESDEEPEYMQRLVAYYAGRVKEIERGVKTNDRLKQAILAALLVTDELFRERRGATEVERATADLLHFIDKSLDTLEE